MDLIVVHLSVSPVAWASARAMPMPAIAGKGRIHAFRPICLQNPHVEIGAVICILRKEMGKCEEGFAVEGEFAGPKRRLPDSFLQ